MNVMLGGLRIIQNSYCTIRQQYRFPRSKRRRIRAKWSKRARNYRHLPDPNVYVMRDQGAVVMHPATWRKLERKLKTSNSVRVSSAPPRLRVSNL
jgi:hypothetical protein